MRVGFVEACPLEIGDMTPQGQWYDGPQKSTHNRCAHMFGKSLLITVLYHALDSDFCPVYILPSTNEKGGPFIWATLLDTL
mgnify:CR=1 FL=1